jgi:large subunit ribosomal protein L30
VPRKKAVETTVQLRITQIRSGVGRPGKHRATLEALGLKHHQHTVIKQDHPAIRGMIRQVSHMLKVEEMPGGEA